MRFVQLGSLLVPLGFLLLPQAKAPSFREEQMKFVHVRAAAVEKDAALQRLFTEKDLPYPPRALFVRAFKHEGILEAWSLKADGKTYALVKSYGICATSGILGPKRRNGDLQVPEGFYTLDWLNPSSGFYLSLHIDYPNTADRILGLHGDWGGNIFLHGNCVTIGCIPITDDGIKEVYWLAVLARAGGQSRVPIHIFPGRLSEESLRALEKANPKDPVVLQFWGNLKPGYDYFERTHQLPRITVDPDGSYRIAP